MGNHFTDRKTAFSDSERELISRLQVRFNLGNAVKYEELPKDRFTRLLSGSKPRSVTMCFQLTNAAIAENHDSLYAMGKEIAREYVKLTDYSAPYININFLNKFTDNYDSVRYNSYQTRLLLNNQEQKK